VRKIILKIFIATTLIVFFNKAYSQISIRASLDTNQILIGDQIKLILDITKPSNLNIQFPVLKDTIIKEIEVLDASLIDTIAINGNNVSLRKEYTITSFDSGLYVIPSLNFTYQHDTITDSFPTNPIYMAVRTFEVDTVSKKIFDVKKPYDAPWSIMEFLKLYWYYLVIGAAVILLLLIAYRVFKRLKKKEPIIKIIEKPKIPAHIIALKDLDKLKEQKLWQNNKIKKYHSKLTDIVRKYIENRFGISAMEQTSYEILDAYSRSGHDQNNAIEYLRQMLTLADFVKFAKAHPLPNENDISMKNAYSFVNETKQETIIETEQEVSLNKEKTND